MNPMAIAFREVAEDWGVQFAYRSGSEAEQATILESLGGGVGVIDFDHDGQWDLLTVGGGELGEDRIVGGRPLGMFRQTAVGQFDDLAAHCGLDAPQPYTHGVAVGDYDNDGFSDLLITGFGRLQLWRNQGDGTFAEQAEAAGLNDDQWSTSAAWADFNGDGLLDLYVCHYVDWSFTNHPFCESSDPKIREICSPRVFNGLNDRMYFNRGDGSFEDVSKSAGLVEGGKGLGVVVADLDLDGDCDIYVANDTTENFLYVNDGTGKFLEMGLIAGVALDDDGIPNGSMGVDVCDFNCDGRPDLWVANYERESFALYRNEGGSNFLHVSMPTGITALGGLFVGFGTAFHDFDCDGDEDVVVANGHVIKFPRNSPRRQLPLLLLQEDHRFRRLQFNSSDYFGQAHEGRGLAVADLDDDGDQDVIVSHINDPIAILQNESVAQQASLAVRLVGAPSNRDATGAVVDFIADSSDAQPQHQHCQGGGSYLSTSSPVVWFAVPDEGGTLRIRWPSGAFEEYVVEPGVRRLICYEGDSLVVTGSDRD